MSSSDALAYAEQYSPISDWHQKKLNSLDDHLAAQGETLVRQGRWTPPHHPEIEVTAATWERDFGAERTLGWVLHQFKFLPALIAFDRHSGSMDGATCALDLFRAWWAIHSDAPRQGGGMAWHDHATGLRLQNLLLLRSHLIECRQREELPCLESVCREHASTLADENFYTRDNNHGLDQSLALFEYARELHDPQAEKLALERIEWELGQAFAEDGGHVENSTGYQNFGIAQATHAAELGKHYLGRPLGLDPQRLARAKEALAFMTRPDRLLPHIGDTSDFTAPRLPQPTSDELILPKSGWAILRSGWDSQAVHIVLRSGFLSVAHRHDDDLSFTLFAFAEEWITDGGRYTYQEKDPMRRYMRSSDAHSLPAPLGLRASRQIEIGSMSRIKHWTREGGTSTVAAESGMFPGYRAERSLQYDRSDHTIRIDDHVLPLADEAVERVKDCAANGARTYLTRFLIPRDKRVAREPGRVIIRGQRRSLIIETPIASRLVSGQTEPKILGWRSRLPGVAEPAYDLSFYTSEVEHRASFTLRWA